LKVCYRGTLTFSLPALMAIFLLGGCTFNQPYTSMKTAFQQGEILKVGVIPFENLTPNIKAGEDLADYCYNSMFRQLYSNYQTQIGNVRFEMEDEFRLKEILHKNKWQDQTAHLDVGLANMAKTLGVDVLMLGTVSEYHYKRGLGEDPVVSMHLRLYDLKHDTIIWSGSHSKVGRFSWFKEDALGRLSRQLSEEMVEKMLKELDLQVSRIIIRR
jgi:polysaccharide biosynthesis protein PelC